MKRLSLIALVLLAFFMLAWVLVQAQDPTGEVGEQIDDLTPLRVEPADQADDSDDRRIPEAYIQATGGPDAFGYTYIDSDGDGCTYDWIEIETTGTDLELIGDNMGAALPIGFSFPFCENSFTVISATTNGYLTFGPDLTDSTDDAIPSIIDPNDLIAVFWDDQEIDQIEGDAVYYQLFGTPGSQYVVVEFLIRDRYGSAPYRYEAVLYGNGDLKFQYNEMTTDLDGDGTSAAVGIENSRGTVGLGYMYHLNPAGNDIHNGLAVCIHYPDNVYLSPGWQAGYGTEEQVVSYDLLALNQTGATREFDLAAEDFAWPTAVTPTQTTIPAGETVSVTVAVTIPSGTVGLTDTATIRVSAVLDPAVYSDTAQVETTALSGLYGFTGASATDEAAVFDQQLHIMFQRLDLLPEGDYPYDATMTPDGSEVWTPGASGDGVVVIDTTSGTVSQRIAVGDYPIGVAFRKDSAYGFVSNRNTNDVSVIDATSYTVVDSIPIDAAYDPGNLAANPCASEIYMVDWYDDGLLVLDADTFAVTQVLTEVGQSLWQLVTNPLGDRLYVTDRGQDVVHVLDTATLSETATIPVGDDPWGIDITPDGSLIYVANEDSHDVTAIDTTNNSVIVTIALPHDDAKPRDVDFSANGAYAYVTSGDVGSTRVHDEVYVIDTATHTVVHRIDVDPARNTNVVAVAPQMSSCLGLFADKRAAPEPVVLGDPLTYTVRYGYAGLVPATGVLVTDSLPGGTAYLTSTGGLSSTYDTIDHRVLWDLGTVPVGERGVLTAQVQPVDEALVGQTITNEAYLDFTGFANFSATVWVADAVVAPELAIRYPDGSAPPDPLLLCEGVTVTLAGVSNRSGPLDYAWELGDGTTASTPLVTHNWSYGDYTVLLTTTNAYGWVETDTLALDVGHVPVASFLSNSPVNLGQNAVFTDTTTYEPTSWSWDFGDAVGTSNEPDPIYNYSNPGIYTVTLTVGNYCGTDVYADVFAVNYPVYLPLVTNDYNDIQCETHAASLTLSATTMTLAVGQAVIVTATLANEGCGMLGVPLYSLDVQSSEAQPIFDPMDPEPVLHHIGIGLGDSDSAEFVLQALAPGQATLYGSVSYEVHLGFPGPAYWSGSSAGPLVITVAP